MTGVGDRMMTGVFFAAGLLALWWLGTTGDRRVDDGGATVTAELIEADPGTGGALPCVARLLTPVLGAGEELTTHQGARVLSTNTTQLPAFVPPTASLLLTSFLTASIVCAAGQL